MTPHSSARNAPSDTPPESAGITLRDAAEKSGVKVVESRELFGRLSEIGIMHDGSLYRLKITRQGKLILNK
ncbi:hemin uptake protein HemP [Pseudohoeflea suaedae]|uniref:Hemin uptake protein HemP n=1 Tax=Pseudohoeflea suaedae TaxID=877384 RepID=A0A4R5PQC4_9HYPH|nr:hemin uptake protein HemP [Pseudohoeflea suaedae]